MKKPLLILLSLFTSSIVFAQSFLNPSFESVNSPSCAFNLSNTSFNAVILNTVAFGTYGDCDIINSSCGYGIASNGDWFLGLSVPPGGVLSDAISAEVSPSMTPGNTYQVTFDMKKDVGYDCNPLEVGYSDQSTSMGTIVTTFPVFTSSNWQSYTFSFSPTTTCDYVTFRVQGLSYGWNHLDNLSIVTTTGLEAINSNDIKCYSDNGNLYISFNHSYTRASIKLMDYNGRVVSSDEIHGEMNYSLPVAKLPVGLYFLSLDMDNQQPVFKKLLIDNNR